ncbi:hypothetical protein BC829DRAFT_31434 [Chytridium lagenaria]|nr:hypothetical protein BC829DRAFT_31434 [Chytridium lagenaria]
MAVEALVKRITVGSCNNTRVGGRIAPLSNFGICASRTLTFLKSCLKWERSPMLWPSCRLSIAVLIHRFANLSKTFEKTPFSEFPQNYKNICSFKNSTTNDTMHFCIPINIFAQKVFYRPSVLAYNNVSIPVNFESLLDVCQKFASRGKSLFFFGLKLPMIFPVQYYFGALFTRLWGSELYEKLLSGNWPWVSHEVSTVMDHWKMMIDNKCFGNGTFQNSYDHTYTDQWWGASVENATFAMAVMPSWYNYYRRDGPEPLINGDIPSMPFPRIRQNISRVEIMSAEAVAVGSKSKNVPAAIEMAELFTGFEAQKQGLINGGVTSSFIPGAGSLNNSDYKILSTADQVVLWFDGISGFQFAGPAYKYFRDFLLNPTTWARSAKALDDLATELYHSKTPDPSVNVDLLRSGNSSNQDETMIFTDKATVVLAPATNDAMIYYTLDGTEPIAGTSNLYQGPINLAPPRTFNPVTFQVKAISFKSGLKFLSNVTAINITIQRSRMQHGLCIWNLC